MPPTTKMRNSRATYRYAKSLVELSQEQGTLEQCHNDMEHIIAACKASHDLHLLLKSPVVKTDKKQRILNEVFGQCDALTKQFIQLITAKKREALLVDIAQRFLLIYKEMQGIETAQLTTASPIDEETRQAVLAFIKQQGVQQVDLKETVDDKLIGGLVLRLGDKQVDASVARQIYDLKQTFNKNLYIKDF